MTIQADTDHNRVLIGIQTGQTPNPMLLKLKGVTKMEEKTPYYLFSLGPLIWGDLDLVSQSFL